MKTQIIAITGRARHGKDTLAKVIKEELENKNKMVVSMAFADLLKEEVCQELDIPDISILNYFKNNNMLWNGVNVRRAHQIIADYKKLKNPYHYADYLLDKIQKIRNKLDNSEINLVIIITDLRMLIEEESLKWLKEHDNKIDLKILKIRRDIDNISESNHPSEYEVDEIKEDILINNDNTILNLKLKVSELIKTNFI